MLKSFDNCSLKIYVLAILILVIKLLLLPYAQTESADAVSRIFASLNWLENPNWITTSVWAPFHFYINGIGLYLWDDRVIMPKLINILFSTFTLIPFYFFTKREFNANGAFVATVFLAISPILFRNSFIALSETPYLFFLTLTINLLSKAIREKSVLYTLLSGLSITIAAGIRYEAWIIIGVCCLICLLIKEWKMLLLFGFTASLFPIYWFYSNWMETGDPFYSIQGTYHYALDVMDRNANMDFESYLRRIWFFPFSWVIAVGIPTGFIVLKTIFKSYTKTSRNKHYILLSIPFWIVFLFYQYNTLKGVLLLQHRYVGTLVILSLPFIALYFSELTLKKIKLSVIFGALTILLSFVYNTYGITPLPRLETQSTTKISEIINKNTTPASCLILDFIGWDNTYYLALQSNLSQKNIVITEGAENSEIPLQNVTEKLKNHQKGIVLLKKDSELYRNLSPNQLQKENEQLNIKTVYQKEDILVFSWQKLNN